MRRNLTKMLAKQNDSSKSTKRDKAVKLKRDGT